MIPPPPFANEAKRSVNRTPYERKEQSGKFNHILSNGPPCGVHVFGEEPRSRPKKFLSRDPDFDHALLNASSTESLGVEDFSVKFDTYQETHRHFIVAPSP
ncbi:hypothetical protein NLI96_g10765 [Meripilus lineatus]|uniref:Uncharacterized protein n=1 Tax=Meripilus lineatus TaxID=2056292 RepID=A0AAD5UTC1_9APHY|nr:hypothetical protein NLI96_g10765 [Physisporinus lineatus]